MTPAERITFDARVILAKLEKALAETVPEMFEPVGSTPISDPVIKAFLKYQEKQRLLAIEFPHHYPLYFRAFYGSPKYEAALQLQKDVPAWCETHFAEGTWMYDPDMDGTLDFRFKGEDQLMLFKLRWHKNEST